MAFLRRRGSLLLSWSTSGGTFYLANGLGKVGDWRKRLSDQFRQRSSRERRTYVKTQREGCENGRLHYQNEALTRALPF